MQGNWLVHNVQSLHTRLCYNKKFEQHFCALFSFYLSNSWLAANFCVQCSRLVSAQRTRKQTLGGSCCGDETRLRANLTPLQCNARRSEAWRHEWAENENVRVARLGCRTRFVRKEVCEHRIKFEHAQEWRCYASRTQQLIYLNKQHLECFNWAQRHTLSGLNSFWDWVTSTCDRRTVSGRFHHEEPERLTITLPRTSLFIRPSIASQTTAALYRNSANRGRSIFQRSDRSKQESDT